MTYLYLNGQINSLPISGTVGPISVVFRLQAEKDAKDAQVAANQLLQFSKNFLAQIFYSYDKTEAIVSREDLDALIKIANVSDHVIEADTLQALLNCEVITSF